MRPAVLLLVALALPAHGHEGGGDQAVSAARERDEMVRIPAGAFVMGVDVEERDELVKACEQELARSTGREICEFFAAHYLGGDAQQGTTEARRVFVSAFEIDRQEVTTRRYRACVAARACDPRPLASGDVRYIKDEWPVVNVTWTDADDYCRWRGKRLPTEAEWEKAARGDDGRRWPWGDRERADGANHGAVEPELATAPASTYAVPDFVTDDSDGVRALAAPGSFPWGKSPFGVEDLSGNVSEWVADWYDEKGYAGMPTTDPRGAAPGALRWRVGRGGSFVDPRFAGRTYYRDPAPPHRRSIARGFRCARDVP
jgi:formylglycine-generating enzyme required for sulfatase activity